MRYIILAAVAVVAFIVLQQVKKAKAMRRRKENAKNKAILQEILDSRR